MNDEMTDEDWAGDSEGPSFEKNSVDEPYTVVGDRWSDAVVDGCTATGTADDVAGSEDSKPDSPYLSFFLTRMKTGECFQLVGDPFYVGKSKEASYQIRGTDTISRLHVCFHVGGGECWIEDNRSLNGTWVDGVSLTPYCRVRVNAGARIQLSEEDFLLETKVL